MSFSFLLVFVPIFRLFLDFLFLALLAVEVLRFDCRVPPIFSSSSFLHVDFPFFSVSGGGVAFWRGQ